MSNLIRAVRGIDELMATIFDNTTIDMGRHWVWLLLLALLQILGGLLAVAVPTAPLSLPSPSR